MICFETVSAYTSFLSEDEVLDVQLRMAQEISPRLIQSIMSTSGPRRSGSTNARNTTQDLTG
jgi:hypothetical protein